MPNHDNCWYLNDFRGILRAMTAASIVDRPGVQYLRTMKDSPKMMNGSRKTALITGATRGLGWEFAEILAARGYDLVLTGRDEAQLLDFKRKHEKQAVTTVVADLSVPGGAAAVLAAVKKSGATIEVLVNNAGFGDRQAFAESDLAKQEAMVQVNVASLVSLTHGLLPGMVRRKSAGWAAGVLARLQKQETLGVPYSASLSCRLRP